MIAMQYSFTLPADYDMSIIDRRIAEKGPLLDNLPNLRMKAYLTARREADRENLYAPFYVWHEATGLNDFLSGEGFVGLTQAFGWPSVRSWFVWEALLTKAATAAVFATRELRSTAPHTSLADLRKRESEEALLDVERHGALASVSAFEPTSWARVRFQLWGEKRHGKSMDSIQAYQVGHISLPVQADHV